MRIKLFEEFSEWDGDEFLLDLFTMTSTEVNDLFWEEIGSKTPHIEKINVMIESGLVDVRTKDDWKKTPLHWACGFGSVDSVQLLLDRGADLEAKDIVNQTPLQWACFTNATDCIQLLLDRGANPRVEDIWGFTPLHWASKNDNVVTAKLLLERGAKIKTINDDGRTPLELAQSDKMRALLSGGGL